MAGANSYGRNNEIGASDRTKEAVAGNRLAAASSDREGESMNSIKQMLMCIASFGKGENGSYTRGCYTPEYFQAVKATRQVMEELGMEVSEDAAGNVRGVLSGTDPALPHILMGSHLDTVPQGGLFDGAYGVAGALETVRQLKENGTKLRHTVEIYGFNGEESNPIGGTFGSRAIAGLIDVKQPGFTEALAQYGHTPEEILACKRDFADAKCYLELHIEQGDHLFNEGLDIGVVSGIVGIVRYRVTALGKSNHAGTTLMKNRQDAMVGMAKLITNGDALCRAIDDNLVFTVGTITCEPGSENVIPGKVVCTFEMRHMDSKMTDRLIAKIEEAAQSIPNCQFTFEKRVDKGSIPCDRHLMENIEKSAAVCGTKYVVMPSGAGHDANAIGHRVPVGMIFVPSKDGLSHCKEEWTDEGYLVKGQAVLARTVLELDRED